MAEPVLMYQVILTDSYDFFICEMVRDRSYAEAKDFAEHLNPCLGRLNLAGFLKEPVTAVAMPQEAHT